MNDTYLNYNTDQLAADPAVQAYVYDGAQAEVWDAWLTEHPDVAVRMLQAQRILTRLQSELHLEATPQDVEAADRVWKKVRAQTYGEAKTVGLQGWVRERKWGRLGLVASAAAAMILVVFYLMPQGDVYATRLGEIEVVALPDGSQVTLAPHSSLRVDDYADTRTVTLTGQAFFEVEKGIPFYVNTAEGRVAVLGTSFEVDALHDRLAVACASGKVRVEHDDTQAILTPGLAVMSLDEQAGLSEPYTHDAAVISSWRNRRLRYEDRPLEEVFDDLERFYGRDFQAAGTLAYTRVTLEVPSDDFPALVKQLGFVLQLPVDTSRNALYVRR